MNNLDLFIEQLLLLLDDLPESLIEQTKEFYDSFILDAKDEGLTDEEILKKLGNPLHIANQIKLDYYLSNESSKRKRFVKVSAAVFGKRAVLTGFAAITSVVTFFLWMSFVLIQISSIIGAFAWLGLMLSQTIYFRNIELVSVFGQLGIAFIGFSFLLICAILFNFLSRVFQKTTIRLVTGKKHPLIHRGSNKTKVRFVILSMIFAVSMISMLFTPTLTYASSIWLSYEDPLLLMQTHHFSPDDVNLISLELMNASLDIRYAEIDEITITYVEEPWLDFTVVNDGGVLYLIETTNHELPFMSFIARHPGMHMLTITLPVGMSLDHLFIETVGSQIYLEAIDYNVSITCDTSLIQFSTSNCYNYDIQTTRGDVLLNHIDLGESYSLNQGVALSIQIEGKSARIEGIES